MHRVVTLTMNPAVDLSTSVARVVPTHKLRCSGADHDPGGGGINVARVVARMGGAVTAVYPTGGCGGQWLKRLVDREGLPSVTFDIAEETRFSFTALETGSGDEYRFVLPGPSLGETEWQQGLDTLGHKLAGADFVVMSGSLPPGVPQDFYARVTQRCNDSGARPVIDSAGAALAAALDRGGVFLIKPNLRELRELTGHALQDEASFVAVCSNLVSSGKIEAIALTLGDRGALLVSRDTVLRAPALSIQPASAVGAGDSFLGGMVFALASGHDLETAFRYGVAAGSAALLTKGTQLCRREDVLRLLGEVSLHAVGHGAAD
ncbi:1-phosphofructokinase family hexose kinase [Pseudorhodoplanes sp.]|uniref:1-phosphofructokinase family hexose kinase n=1 Tax=Pseudorhodoplanes sp. TaxID=1934341 RepID=UPI003918E88D